MKDVFMPNFSLPNQTASSLTNALSSNNKDFTNHCLLFTTPMHISKVGDL